MCLLMDHYVRYMIHSVLWPASLVTSTMECLKDKAHEPNYPLKSCEVIIG